jgi:hypothetical protein
MTLSDAQTAVLNILGPLDGTEIPGGCDHCDAYQTVKPVTAGVWSVTVHHDDDCPWWLERQGINREQRRASQSRAT